MSTNDFKAGMVAGAKPFGDKLDQLANVTESAVSDIKEGLDGVSEVVNIVLDDLSAQEKKRIYDLDEATDISNLEDDEKEFLVAVLAELANTVPYVSDLQRSYILSVCSTVGIAAPQVSINLANIENIENMRTQKVLLRHVMEFFFIGTQNYDFLDEYEETVFCYFGVNKRGVNEIITAINRIYNAMGIEGLANRYTFVAGYEELIQTEETTDEDAIEELEAESMEMEELRITNMVQIPTGETKTYRYKEIHPNTLINCSGVLELDNCCIIYNESTNADEISLSAGAEIRATNCTFICKGVDKNHFISLVENCSATFEKCIFIDCSYFLKATDANLLKIDNCELYNCNVHFADAKGNVNKAGEVKIINSKISVDDTFKVLNMNDYHCVLFSISYVKCEVESISVINHCENNLPEILFFDINYGGVANSYFYGLISCVRATVITNCVFEKCKGDVLKSVVEMALENNSCVRSCVFDDCTGIINPFADSIITQCKFVNCTNDIIFGGTTDYGVEISYCEFINYKRKKQPVKKEKTNFLFSWGENEDSISAIKLSAGKGSKQSTIKKCIFDGVNIEEGFLIRAEISGKVSNDTAKIVDCDFRNCVTKRDSGKIIKTFATYIGMFDKVHTEEAVSIQNCRGLDRVSKSGTGVCSDKNVLSSVSVAKSKSKSAAVIGGLGIIGSPLTAAVAIGVNAVIKKNKEKEQEMFNKASQE